MGAYIHLPWCVQKCPYCDFNSHGLRNKTLPEHDYTEALVRDLEREAHATASDQRLVASVFFGGGTPSLFSAASIGRVIAAIDTHFGLARQAEITLEANPGAVEHGSFAELLAAGVNRISLGAQSFDNTALKTLGRVHRAEETVNAVRALRRAGFDNFNLDLMYALPDQQPEQARSDLASALALEPTHLSHYQLTLEPNTLFYQKPPTLPDDDTAWTMHQHSLEQLSAAGFVQYEVSAYAQPGMSSQHNLNYWRFGDYIGIGAGAHGKLTRTDGRVERTIRPRHPTAYMATDFNAPGARQANPVGAAGLCFEYPLNVLRLKDEPLTLTHFEQLTGVAGQSLRPALHEAVAKQLLRETDPGCYVKTDLGWRFLNDLQAVFLVS